MIFGNHKGVSQSIITTLPVSNCGNIGEIKEKEARVQVKCCFYELKHS